MNTMYYSDTSERAGIFPPLDPGVVRKYYKADVIDLVRLIIRPITLTWLDK